jgi:NAD+ synthase (glutamine-hydrolysing)
MGYKENINEDILDALVLGTKDYFIKNKFRKAVIGLSGGIDSALTAVIAVKALGKENVLCVSMPSRFSSEGSVKDSVTLAENLGVKLEFVPIKSVFDVYLDALAEKFRGTEFNVAEENIQARIRGNILMAISNKFGHLVLATGNKSELSVGYATLYGDMSGGLSVISDVLKTKVYELCNYINERDGGIVIPKEIITKEPSAELKEDQKDSDSLPEYNVLDPILIAYINDDESKENIIKMGFDKKIVEKVTGMVDKTEYKRRQAAIGLRITPRAFGVGRRMPITNGWVED